MTEPAPVLTFREGLTLVEVGGEVTLSSRSQSVPLRRVTPGLLAAFRSLAAEGATADELAAAVESADTASSLPVLFFYLQKLESLGLFCFSARVAGVLAATLTPSPVVDSTRRRVAPVTPEPHQRHELSRFALLRRDGARFVAESPLGRGRVVFHDPRALAVCHALAEPRTLAELSALLPEAPVVLALLLGAAVATAVAPDVATTPSSGALPPGEGAALAMWSFHDLLFHTRSRWGRNTEPAGATFRFAGQIEPLPALRPPAGRAEGAVSTAPSPPSRIALHRPDIDALRAADIPFTRVLEDRTSIRAHGETPIHVRQLGELLFRAARVRSLGTSTGGVPYPTTNRPYASGGACYELETYLVVHSCEGLAPGLYHHDPLDHALTPLSGRTPATDTLLAGARAAMLAPAPPQVLLVWAARFGRVLWKYESTAYATILKDVGSLLQTVYLVATAMDLAPCALGCGDSDLFAEAAGLDYLAETSVGEMALGSRAPRAPVSPPEGT